VIDPATFTGWMGLSLLVLGGLMAALPVGTCSQCVHCREERLRAEQLRKAREVSNPLAGQFACRRCGRAHDEDVPCFKG
jgi:hypothetical protein